MKRLIVFVILACSLSSCLISLHPLYTAETTVTNPLLEGKWLEDDEGMENSPSFVPQRWEFKVKNSVTNITVTNSEGDSYKVKDESDTKGHYVLNHYNEEGNYSYDAVLLKLGEYYYLDVFPDEPLSEDDLEEENYPVLANYIPTHNFYRVDFENEDRILLYPFDGDRMEKLVKERKIRIKHENVNGNFVITAGTEDLQKFILKYAEDAATFDEPMCIERTSE